MTWTRFSEAEKAEIWDSIERGESFRVIVVVWVVRTARSGRFWWTTPAADHARLGARICG